MRLVDRGDVVGGQSRLENHGSWRGVPGVVQIGLWPDVRGGMNCGDGGVGQSNGGIADRRLRRLAAGRRNRQPVTTLRRQHSSISPRLQIRTPAGDRRPTTFIVVCTRGLRLSVPYRVLVNRDLMRLTDLDRDLLRLN